MSEATVLGLNAFIEQPQREVFRGGVWKRVRSWEGPKALLDEAVWIVQLLLTPDQISTVRGTPATIEAEFGDFVSGRSAKTLEQVCEDNAVWEVRNRAC
jgi:hypothetical protein